MSRAVFKSNEQGQVVLFPAGLDEKVPQDSPARLVNQIVDNLDIAEIIDTYKGGGTSAYHPRMMLKVVLYSYLNNIYSSRKIEQALADRISFMWLSGGQQPDHNTINRFRSCHLKEDIHGYLELSYARRYGISDIGCNLCGRDQDKSSQSLHFCVEGHRRTKAKPEEKIRSS